MADDALKSLYGAGHAAASRAELAKTRTRECVAMPGARNQTVLTPQTVIDGLLALWPEGIAFDAAHGPESIVPAAEKTSTRGLLDSWPHRTYANPPYGACLRNPARDGAAAHEHEVSKAAEKAAAKAEKRKPRSIRRPDSIEVAGLGDWLEHQLERSEGESVVLAPVRTHRKWFRAWLRRLGAAVFLDPLKFEGYAQAFPAPLVLGFYIGPQARIALVEERVVAFVRAFAHLGDPLNERQAKWAEAAREGR